MGKYFGTDGFRGEANINLTVEHAYKVGRYIGCGKKINVEAAFCPNCGKKNAHQKYNN